jgi:hypothetical protein
VSDDTINQQAVKDNNTNDSSEIDWVTERYMCSVPMVFNTLREQVENDVKTRNDRRPESAPYEFSMEEDVGEFTVVRKLDGARKSVTFKLEGHAVVILDHERLQLFEVAVRFTEDGKCQLKAKDEKCEFWQVRRMALEPLMFHAN